MVLIQYHTHKKTTENPSLEYYTTMVCYILYYTVSKQLQLFASLEEKYYQNDIHRFKLTG